MAFKRVIIRRVGPLFWLLGASVSFSRNLCFVLATLLAFTTSCTTLRIPKELKRNEVTEMLNAIGAKEHSRPYLIQYLSDTRPVPIPNVAGTIPRISNDYGVRLYFRESSCSSSRGYVFIRKDGAWVEDITFYSTAPQVCP
jgi:hypothetical protein